MPQPTVKNQAEIDAANRARIAAQQRVAAAQAGQTKFVETNAQSVLEKLRATTANVKEATKALQAGPGKASDKIVSKAAKAVEQRNVAMAPLLSEWQGVQSTLAGAQAELASINVPAPIYSTSSGSTAALDAILASLAAIGVEGLAGVMNQIREEYPDISSEDALLLLKFDPRYNKPYMTRFSGNKMRMDAGFAPLDDKEYLANEAAFSKIFTAYGIDKQFANRAEYARQIGNRVAPQELAERVSLGYDRLTKGATETLKAITTLFPELTDKDLLAYVIDPVNQLPAITRKVQAAEIGGAALAQNLTIGLTTPPTTSSGYTNVARTGLSIDELLAQGVDLQTARRGFANVAEVLPTAEKLSGIYGNVLEQYGRQQAEEEQFKGLASAQRKREQLTQREIAAFSGEAGPGRGAFSEERSF
jgi:hypothetical protein